MWGLDVIVCMRPQANGGNEYLLIAFCAFSKWVEVGMLTWLTAWEVQNWFHWEIVYWFGVPLLVCVNCGVEFWGVSVAYLYR